MASVDPEMPPLLPPLLLPLPLPPLTSASTDDQGKPHSMEVVGSSEKDTIGHEAFLETSVCHEILSLCPTLRVNSYSLEPTSMVSSHLCIWC